MRNFKFEKEENRWYVVLPEWEKEKSELEMVMGADTMLDIVSQGESVAYLSISKDIIPDPKFILTLEREEYGGGTYKLKSDMYEFDVWLCHVIKFIYGKLPDKLYCK
jgi:hypothetical protein